MRTHLGSPASRDRNSRIAHGFLVLLVTVAMLATAFLFGSPQDAFGKPDKDKSKEASAPKDDKPKQDEAKEGNDAGAGATATAASGWNLVWSDEFSGNGAPDPSKWNYAVGNGINPGTGSYDGWGNGEWEWYRPENCFQSGGNLVIKAEWLSSPMNIGGRDWYQKSCRITTDTKHSWRYGKIEARIAMPNAIGSWPAFWMLGDACDETSTGSYNPAWVYGNHMPTNWASCGEIDIMEHKNYDSSVVNNLFWDTRTGLFPWNGSTVGNNPSTVGSIDAASFNVYAIEWDATEIRWLLNGSVTKTVNITRADMEEFHKPFHIIMNLALSGTFAGAEPVVGEFPLTMLVDYVRVYQQGGNGGGDDDGDDGGGDDGTPVQGVVQAEAFTAGSGVGTESTADTGGGQNIGWIADGDWVQYVVDFGDKPKKTIDVRVASGVGAGASGLIEIREGGPTGKVIGSMSVANTEGWQSWTTIPAQIKGQKGVKTIALTFASGQPADFVNVNWFSFR